MWNPRDGDLHRALYSYYYGQRWVSMHLCGGSGIRNAKESGTAGIHDTGYVEVGGGAGRTEAMDFFPAVFNLVL